MSTPDIISFAPSAGPESGGTPVAINVSSISASTLTPKFVDFGTLVVPEGNVTETSDTSITAVSPANSAGGSVFVSITWSDGTISQLSTNQFVYVVVDSVTPSSGTVLGGAFVTIKGSGLSEVAKLLFNNTSADFTKVDDTTITTIAPNAGSDGPGPATISFLDAQDNPVATLLTSFTYNATPTIEAITPSSGSVTGKIQAAITGSGLLQAATVQFNTAAAAISSGATDTQITVTVPPGSPGNATVNLFDSNGDNIGGVPGGFTYLDAPVGTLSPSSGPIAGNIQATITGSGLLQVAKVQFGSSAVAVNSGGSDSSIAVNVPSGSAGNVAVTLLDSLGSTLFTVPGGFTYVSPAPAVASISPTSGPQAGGTQITITGTGFTGATNVAFGTTNVTQIQNISDTSISVASPAANSAGAVPITVSTPNGTSQGNVSFTYVAASSTGGQPGGQNPNQNTNPNQNQNANPSQTTTTQTGPSNPLGPAPTGPSPGQGAPSSPGGQGAPSAGAGGNTASYYPGGLAPVPGGQTGLGGTAGTGAGFGVGTLMAGGGGSAPESNLSYYVDPALTAQLVQTLVGLVQNASTPDAIESQNIILRRMALDGDVIGSRIPPPRNISEIGGYLNLLGTLKENAMREQALAGVLGVAGPTQPLGWISNTQTLSMVAVSNDRPAVAAQPSFPLTILVRSDFVSAVQNAFTSIHSYGATLPLTSPSVILLPPGGTGAPIPTNLLFYLGRTLMIAPSAAVTNPVTDPVALLAPSGSATDYGLASQVLSPGTFAVTPADVQAVQCTPTSETLVSLSNASFVPLAPILAAAGFYSQSPFPVPANSTDTSWAWLTNTTGLVAGSTELGDELSLLYRQDQIAASAFAAMLTWTWNGTAFGP